MVVIRLPALIIDFASYEIGIYAQAEIKTQVFLSKAFEKKFESVSSSAGFLALDMWWELGGGTGAVLTLF